MQLKQENFAKTTQSQMYVIAAGYNCDICATNKTTPQKYVSTMATRDLFCDKYARGFNYHLLNIFALQKL